MKHPSNVQSQDLKPKILVISTIDIFKDNNSSGLTIRSFMGGWSKDDIYQIVCTHDSVAKGRMDDHLYILNREDIMFGEFLRWHRKSPQKATNIYEKVNHIQKKSVWLKFRSAIVDVYSVLPYHVTDNLEKFIRESRADIIYCPCGSPSIFFLVDCISKRFGIRHIFHFFDDWPNVCLKNFYLARCFFTNKLYGIIQNSPVCLCISNQMCDEYRLRYRYEHFLPMMNCVSRHKNKFSGKNSKKTILYAGSLSLGRHEMLINICEIIKGNQMDDLLIKVFTQSVFWEEVKQQYAAYTFIEYGGFVSHEKLIEEESYADGFLILESFRPELLEYTRLSLSTKIPEYLSQEKPILAAGHRNQGSIKYLAENKAAYIACVKEDLEHVLIEFTHADITSDVVVNGIKLFEDHHEISCQRKRFEEILIDAVK